MTTTTTVATIQDLLASGRIMEAKALLITEEASVAGEELRDCAEEIEQRLAQAKALVAQAVTLERAGKIGEAKALYESVLPFAADLPGIGRHISRTEEALLLTRAVQRRSERLRRSRPVAAEPNNRRSKLVWAGAGAGLTAAVLLLLAGRPQSPSPEQRMEMAAPAPVDIPQPAPEPPKPPKQVHRLHPAHSSSTTAATHPATPAEIQPAAISAAQQEPPAAAPAPHPPLAPDAGGQAPAVHPQPASATPADRQSIVFYTVQPTDALFTIARTQLCNPAAWQQIFQLNQDRLTDPHKVPTG
ncbi:MAG: hypothetical protein FWC49_02515, partial [Proteobacteria bacterium]|nr:hypothetical protein [Pseudomonadota bacterium]